MYIFHNNCIYNQGSVMTLLPRSDDIIITLLSRYYHGIITVLLRFYHGFVMFYVKG